MQHRASSRHAVSTISPICILALELLLQTD
jgi:hypothetical protein